MKEYQVSPIGQNPEIEVCVPGSKSITNRALLMAAMAQGKTKLKGVLFSDDSRYFLEALCALGFQIEVNQEEQSVTVFGMGGEIPCQNAELYVGSAGTAARFLTAFVAMGKGIFRINSSEQMQKRPMKELFDALRELGAKITFIQQKDTFPVEIEGIRGRTEVPEDAVISLNIDRSSQFLSALLMTAPILFPKLTISLLGSRSAKSYVEMTEQMMKQFGHPGVRKLNETQYQVEAGTYQAEEYQIEPDVSAACYFYAMAAISSGTAIVKHVQKDSLQGDMKFLNVLEQMGCALFWQKGELLLRGPAKGELKGIRVNMSDFSDQALTLAAIAPYANAPVVVENVEHIRGQECNRIQAVVENLSRMKVVCEETKDGFVIYPSEPQPAEIETFEDHRVAMAFSVTGLRSSGMVIRNPLCCRKTFETYFQVLDQIIANNKQS